MLNPDNTRQRVLVFREKGKPGMGVASRLRTLAKSGRHLSVVTAGINSLRSYLEKQAVSAVVIDVGREIGATMSALRILKGFPAIPLFIFNGFLLPRIEEKAKEYTQVRYFEKNDKLDDCIALILAANERKTRTASDSLSLLQLMHLLNLEKWSGRITVTSEVEQGILNFRNGGLIDAATGTHTGRSAWEQMAAWENISVETFADNLPAGPTLPSAAPGATKMDSTQPGKQGNSAVMGNIESLHLIRQDRKLILNLKRLNLGVTEVRSALSTQLVMTDIFLSSNSRSLAGWNSNPLACSQFAAITRSLISSMQGSSFPALGAYYLVDLDGDQLAFIVVRDELQWGFLLKGLKDRLGLLLNIVLPMAMKALDESLAVELYG
ncbi:MAG: DUF4388 domain-containing protein [Candidatus Aminicenantes bacterium]|nr:DUF4388 domain-containing protein [Candidatus Aminicenantes bacterium]